MNTLRRGYVVAWKSAKHLFSTTDGKYDAPPRGTGFVAEQ